jgi:hypothetical protein
MGLAAPGRVGMTRIVALAALLVFLVTPRSVAAEERWALVLSGASGGPKYAEDMKKWRSALVTALVDRYGFDKAKVRVFADETDKTNPQGTAANVRSALAEVKKQLTRDDVLLLILLGHGTYDGDVAKFNLVGPDLTAADWATLLNGVEGRMVVINTTEASFPFLEQLSAPNRVVITATHSAAQKYATVFPDYFVKAMGEASSDLDKNGRTSIFELFAAASLAVKQHFEQRGQLMTEHALLDDNGDRVGRESEAPGPDGALARTLYLDAEDASTANNPELAGLLRRRRELEAEAEALKLKKDGMPAQQWQAEYEKLMLELAKISREIRQKS